MIISEELIQAIEEVDGGPEVLMTEYETIDGLEVVKSGVARTKVSGVMIRSLV